MPGEPGPSPIAGRGTFVSDDHPAGRPVLVLDHAVTDPEDLGPVNHSCDPNLGWSSGTVLGARRDVAAGEELTVDYATFVTDPGFVLYCHCETYRCRQVVEGTDWRIPQLQQRYAGQWAPAVQKLIDEATATAAG